VPLAIAAILCHTFFVNPVLTQRLVTFSTYFFGFLIFDRLSFFGEPPSVMESFVMALVLGLAVSLLSPLLARWLERRASGGGSGAARGLNRSGNERDRMARDAVNTDLGL